VRKFKLSALDSSDSDSDSDNKAQEANRSKGAHSTTKPSAGSSSGGGDAKARRRVNSSSSLELSTSSFNSSSSFSGPPALPAASRKAAAASTAAAHVPLKNTHHSNSSSSSSDRAAAPSLAAQRHGIGAYAAQAPAPVSLGVSQERSREMTVEAPAKLPSTNTAAPGRSEAGMGAGATTLAKLAAVSTVESEVASGSPASASSPTLRSGADFFFKKRGGSPPRTSASPMLDGSAPAAVATFAVRGGSDGDTIGSYSNRNGDGRGGLTSLHPCPSPAGIAVAQPVREAKRSEQTPASASAASHTGRGSQDPAAGAAPIITTTTTTVATPAADVHPPPPSTPALTLRTISIAVRPSTAGSSSSSSSSASTTPRLTAGRCWAAGRSSSSSSSSASSTPAKPTGPLPGAGQQSAATYSTPPSASVAAEKIAVTAVPAPTHLKALALHHLNSDNDEEEAPRTAPSSAVTSLSTKGTATREEGGAAAMTRAADTPSAAASVALSLFPTQSTTHRDPQRTPAQPAAANVLTTTAAAAATAEANASSPPSVSCPSSSLIYNRVSARGIGSVPSSVIEALSRPKRRALPREHTMSGSTAVAPAVSPATKHSSPATSATSVLDGVAQAERVRQNEEREKLNTAGEAALPFRPHREPPRAPRQSHHLLPPTLLEQEEEGKTAETVVGSFSATEAAGILPAKPLRGTADELHAAERLASLPEKGSARVEAGAAPSLSSSPSSPDVYRSRSAAAAAVQRQREAALVIYDDRVPPELRTEGRHAQPFAGLPAPSVSIDRVGARMLLRGPMRSVGTAGLDSSANGNSSLHRCRDAPRGQFGCCGPVLHAGESRRTLAALWRRQKLSHTSDDPLMDEEEEEDCVEVREGKAMRTSTDLRPFTGSSSRRRPSSRSRSTHAHRSPSATLQQPASASVGKSHVSDAVVQQLLRHYGPAGQLGSANDTDATSPYHRDGATHVIAAGRVMQTSFGGGGRERGTRNAVIAPQPSSPSRRRSVMMVGEVDLLHYRSSRVKSNGVA
jgi:hypothetical protein